MKFLKKMVDKKLNLLKYIFKQKTKKEIKIEEPKIDVPKKEFDIYKYFLEPIEERKNIKW